MAYLVPIKTEDDAVDSTSVLVPQVSQRGKGLPAGWFPGRHGGHGRLAAVPA